VCTNRFFNSATKTAFGIELYRLQPPPTLRNHVRVIIEDNFQRTSYFITLQIIKIKSNDFRNWATIVSYLEPFNILWIIEHVSHRSFAFWYSLGVAAPQNVQKLLISMTVILLWIAMNVTNNSEMKIITFCPQIRYAKTSTKKTIEPISNTQAFCWHYRVSEKNKEKE